MTGGYQMRRNARRMRRYGLQPMIVMSPGDRLPDLVLVTLARWAWRYRSELGPLFIAAAAFLTALILHATRPGWWWVILATTAVTATGLAALGQRLGPAALAERVYAVAVVTAGGG